ncbi:MAG TPA: signal recognition particle-docking protein FtsY [Desulfosalsimonadaceae bacterium]|nr:signal recognition particle-docking protein FtsY [Desulfosalsimonadaceae bacterium]
MTAFLWNLANAAAFRFLPLSLALLAVLVLLFVLVRILRRRRLKKTGPAAGGDRGNETAESCEMAEAVREAEQEEAGERVPPSRPKREEPAKKGKKGVFQRLQKGLAKTRQSFGGQVETLFSENRSLDDEALEQIEEALITADVGVDTSMELIRRISGAGEVNDMDSLKQALKKEMHALMDLNTVPPAGDAKPRVIMMVGVNGVGKTTTIGKLASQYHLEGKKVILGAADTFRAAAVEQLEIWAERAGADIVKHRDKADPAAVAYDAVEAAAARSADTVIIDTAGRLHTRVNLMEQLKKIKRTISRRMPDAPHEILLVVDATTGQNAVNQAQMFHQDLGITGIILTKLDGTARGGIVLSISHSLNIPIRYIGVGEDISDLQEFNPQLFVDALLE